jgi:4-hydroxybenzoate polyprenyltransferase
MSRARALLALIRPLDGSSAAAMVALGALLGGASDWSRVTAAAVAAFAATSFAMAVNDLADQVGDRVNGTRRPLVTDGADERAARSVAVGTIVVAVIAAAFVGWLAIAVVTSYLLLGWLYSWRLKLVAPVTAPMTVSLLAASTVVFGGLVSKAVAPTLPAAAIAAIFIFARELLKAARDEEGDRVQGCRTIAVVHGQRRAVQWYAAISVISGALAVAPLLVGASGGYALFAIPNLAYLLCLAVYVSRHTTATRIRLVVDLCKVSWVFWIAAAIVFWS